MPVVTTPDPSAQGSGDDAVDLGKTRPASSYEPPSSGYEAPSLGADAQQSYPPPPGAPAGYPPPSGYPAPAGFPPPAPGFPAGFGVTVDQFGRPLSDKSKVLAGVLQLLLGTFGVGRFYLGYVGIGIAQLLLGWLTCGIWPLIDGILILLGKVPDSEGRTLRD